LKILNDIRLIESFQSIQQGVFSTGDLKTLFAERHQSAFVRRVSALERERVLRRFARNWYVATQFDLPTLSQRIAPESYVSLGTVLARTLIVGTAPEHEIWAVKQGRSRIYSAFGFRIIHLGIAVDLCFGWSQYGGVRWASPEKAVLDTLYFHLRGRRYPFDIYSDLNLGSLNLATLERYLVRYQNPKFISFARRLLDGQNGS
jgi:hypothetical protein